MIYEDNAIISSDCEWTIRAKGSNNGVQTSIRVAISCLPSGPEFEKIIVRIIEEANELFIKSINKSNNETYHNKKLYPTSD